MIVMRLALVTLLFLPALAFGQTKPEDERQGLQRQSGSPVADAAGIDGSEGSDRRFRALSAGARRGSEP